MEDNSKKLWFKRKRYGWGWTPVTWQGWLVIAVYVVALISSTRYLVVLARMNNDDMPPPFKFIPVIVLTAILIAICYAKGEKPGWQWGKEE
jgi:phosphoglycerol transferase MdoB-like AlkP superfamily enzyme